MKYGADDNVILNLRPGSQIVTNRYTIERRIGFGTTSVVYACFCPELSSDGVAVKLLLPSSKNFLQMKERLRTDLVALFALDHTNVIRSYEYFSDEQFTGHVMEVLPNGNLSDYVRRLSHVSLSRALSLIIGIAEGLQAIHSLGLIHRDIKPENILIAADGTPKIADFGVTVSGKTRNSSSQAIAGTIAYMSPEYLERGELGYLSDIYSLAVVAYELVTGRLPFEGPSIVEVLRNQQTNYLIPPSRLRVECGARLDRIICRALAHDPGERYQQAGEFAADLRSYRRFLETDTLHLTTPAIFGLRGDYSEQ